MTTFQRRDPEPAVRKQRKRGLPRLDRFPWRVVSGIILAVCIGLLIFFFASPLFYVTRIEIGGNRYIPPEEVFAASGAANFHILWVEPDLIDERITSLASVEQAEVLVGWPARVIVLVQEREPAVVWEQGENRYWVDVNGNLMRHRADLANVVRVINEGERIPFLCPGPGCPPESDAVQISPEVVLGTMQLKSLRENIDVLYYSEARGLSYQDGRGWRVYFGTGTNMDTKVIVYEQVVLEVLSLGIQPTEIDVSNPDAPYYSGR